MKNNANKKRGIERSCDIVGWTKTSSTQLEVAQVVTAAMAEQFTPTKSRNQDTFVTCIFDIIFSFDDNIVIFGTKKILKRKNKVVYNFFSFQLVVVLASFLDGTREFQTSLKGN